MSVGEIRALGDIADLTIGRTPSRDVAGFWTRQDLTRPFCSIADMTGPRVRPTREGVTQEAVDAGVAKRVKAGTLLMSFKLTVGRVALADVDLYPNEAIVAIEPAEGVDRLYLYFALQAVDFDAITSQAVKGKILNLQTLRSIPVAVPSAGEQRRIVDLLTSADRAVAAATEEHLAAQRLREQLLIDGMRSLAAAPGGKTVKIGDVASTQLGKMLNSASQTGSGTRSYLRAANIPEWGVVDTADLRTMDFSDDELEKFSVQPGDLLVTEGGAAGRCAVYRGEKSMCFQNHIHRVRANTKATTNEFLALVLEHLSLMGQLNRYCSTTTIKMLSASSLKSVEFQLPALVDQSGLVQSVAACTEKVAALRAQRERANQLRDQLLHDLLSGAHTIPESYDRLLAEVAS